MDQPISDPISEPISDPINEPISDPINEPISDQECEEYITPSFQGYFICGLSSCSLMSSIYGFQRNMTISYVPLGVFITSVNYWRKPTRGIRRTIDIMAVLTAISVHLYISLKTNQHRMYMGNMFVCGGLYGVSWYLYKKGYIWSSTISHGLIHVSANIANVLLYQGLSDCIAT